MRPSLGLSMIVRNGGTDLEQCLASVRGVVDEIVIADTGSTDASIATAQRFGARIINIPWENDFARARNASLNAVRSDWVLSLDADEQLDEKAPDQIGKVLAAGAPDGYLITIRNYVQSLEERLWDQPAVANDARLPRAALFAGYLPHQNVRLFRHRPGIYFEGRVHETVGGRIQALGGRLERGEFIIHHFGFTASSEQKAAKNKLYRDLGRQKIAEMPDSGQAHFELGLVEFDNFHNDEEALRLFTRACEISESLAVAWFFRGMALARMGRAADALPCFQRARRMGGNSMQCWEAEGDALYNQKDFTSARCAYRKGIKLAETPGLVSKLGLTELRLGHVEPGLSKLRMALEHGKSAELYDRLITGLVSLNRNADAAAAAEEKLRDLGFSPSFVLRTAVLWAYAQQPQRALQIVGDGLARFPESTQLQAIHAQLMQQHGDSISPQNNHQRLKVTGGPPIGNQQR